MRGEPAPSRDGQPGRSGPSRGNAAGLGGDALRVVRATRDQLGVAWSAEADPLSWQVVCWDSRDVAVARLKLTGSARPSPVLLVCSSRSRSPSPAWEAMAQCSGRLGLPICICGQVALLGEREPPTECERVGTEVRTAKEGGRRCHRSGRRRMRRQARWARRRSRSRRRRPHAGSSRGWGRPSAESGRGAQSLFGL
jgi:hypothetical protein